MYSFPTEDPYNLARVVRFLILKLSCIRLRLQVGKVRAIGAAAMFFCPAKMGADHSTAFCLRQALYGVKTTSSPVAHAKRALPYKP